MTGSRCEAFGIQVVIIYPENLPIYREVSDQKKSLGSIAWQPWSIPVIKQQQTD